MIRTGQTLENPVTGEQLTFRKTSRDTNGGYVLIETLLQPGAFVAAAHVHPYQSERFEMLEGGVGMKADRKKIEQVPVSPLRLAVIAKHHFDDVRLPLIPHVLQRAALAMGAPLGTALGFVPCTSLLVRPRPP